MVAESERIIGPRLNLSVSNTPDDPGTPVKNLSPSPIESAQTSTQNKMSTNYIIKGSPARQNSLSSESETGNTHQHVLQEATAEMKWMLSKIKVDTPTKIARQTEWESVQKAVENQIREAIECIHDPEESFISHIPIMAKGCFYDNNGQVVVNFPWGRQTMPPRTKVRFMYKAGEPVYGEQTERWITTVGTLVVDVGPLDWMYPSAHIECTRTEYPNNGGYLFDTEIAEGCFTEPDGKTYATFSWGNELITSGIRILFMRNKHEPINPNHNHSWVESQYGAVVMVGPRDEMIGRYCMSCRYYGHSRLYCPHPYKKDCIDTAGLDILPHFDDKWLDRKCKKCNSKQHFEKSCPTLKTLPSKYNLASQQVTQEEKPVSKKRSNEIQFKEGTMKRWVRETQYEDAGTTLDPQDIISDNPTSETEEERLNKKADVEIKKRKEEENYMKWEACNRKWRAQEAVRLTGTTVQTVHRPHIERKKDERHADPIRDMYAARRLAANDAIPTFNADKTNADGAPTQQTPEERHQETIKNNKESQEMPPLNKGMTRSPGMMNLCQAAVDDKTPPYDIYSRNQTLLATVTIDTQATDEETLARPMNKLELIRKWKRDYDEKTRKEKDEYNQRIANEVARKSTYRNVMKPFRALDAQFDKPLTSYTDNGRVGDGIEDIDEYVGYEYFGGSVARGHRDTANGRFVQVLDTEKIVPQYAVWRYWVSHNEQLRWCEDEEWVKRQDTAVVNIRPTKKLPKFNELRLLSEGRVVNGFILDDYYRYGMTEQDGGPLPTDSDDEWKRRRRQNGTSDDNREPSAQAKPPTTGSNTYRNDLTTRNGPTKPRNGKRPYADGQGNDEGRFASNANNQELAALQLNNKLVKQTWASNRPKGTQDNYKRLSTLSPNESNHTTNSTKAKVGDLEVEIWSLRRDEELRVSRETQNNNELDEVRQNNRMTEARITVMHNEIHNTITRSETNARDALKLATATIESGMNRNLSESEIRTNKRLTTFREDISNNIKRIDTRITEHAVIQDERPIEQANSIATLTGNVSQYQKTNNTTQHDIHEKQKKQTDDLMVMMSKMMEKIDIKNAPTVDARQETPKVKIEVKTEPRTEPQSNPWPNQQTVGPSAIPPYGSESLQIGVTPILPKPQSTDRSEDGPRQWHSTWIPDTPTPTPPETPSPFVPPSPSTPIPIPGPPRNPPNTSTGPGLNNTTNVTNVTFDPAILNVLMEQSESCRVLANAALNNKRQDLDGDKHAAFPKPFEDPATSDETRLIEDFTVTLQMVLTAKKFTEKIAHRTVNEHLGKGPLQFVKSIDPRCEMTVKTILAKLCFRYDPSKNRELYREKFEMMAMANETLAQFMDRLRTVRQQGWVLGDDETLKQQSAAIIRRFVKNIKSKAVMKMLDEHYTCMNGGFENLEPDNVLKMAENMSLSVKRTTQEDMNRPQRDFSMDCRLCNKPGHHAANCTNRPGVTNRRVNTVICEEIYGVTVEQDRDKDVDKALFTTHDPFYVVEILRLLDSLDTPEVREHGGMIWCTSCAHGGHTSGYCNNDQLRGEHHFMPQSMRNSGMTLDVKTTRTIQADKEMLLELLKEVLARAQRINDWYTSGCTLCGKDGHEAGPHCPQTLNDLQRHQRTLDQIKQQAKTNFQGMMRQQYQARPNVQTGSPNVPGTNVMKPNMPGAVTTPQNANNQARPNQAAGPSSWSRPSRYGVNFQGNNGNQRPYINNNFQNTSNANNQQGIPQRVNMIENQEGMEFLVESAQAEQMPADVEMTYENGQDEIQSTSMDCRDGSSAKN